MDDGQIILLYEARDERAIEISEKQYGGYLHSLIFRILRSQEDTKETLNDTWYAVWKRIPPDHPDHLKRYLARIAQRLALDRLDTYAAKKRIRATMPLDELAESISSDLPELCDEIVWRDIINRFLAKLSVTARRVFLQRYWYSCTVKEIMHLNHMSATAVKSSLFRTRKALDKYLKDSGIDPLEK